MSTPVLRSDRDAALKRLTADGFVVVPDVVDPDTVVRLREAAERLYATDPGVLAKRRSDDDVYSIENLPGKGLEFESYFTNPHVLPLVEEILGEDCTMQEAWSYGVPPGGRLGGTTADKVAAFHIDDVFLCDRPMSVITIYPLVDFTQHNGATRVVPGSHAWRRAPEPGERPAGAVPVEAPAGSCLVFLGSLWHAASPNASCGVRTSVAALYSRPWVKPIIDFTRSLPPKVIERASPTARRLYGLSWRTPFLERWQWDRETGAPQAGATLPDWFGACCTTAHPGEHR